MHGFDIYLVGFHPMKDDPEMQMEAHHYCHQVNEDFAQCMLFDGNTAKANMMPMGGPMLACSFNRCGEALPGMVEERDKTMGIGSTKVHGDRIDLHCWPSPVRCGRSQGQFGRPTYDIPGVADSGIGVTPR